MENSTITTAKKRKLPTTKLDPTLILPEITIPFPTPPPIPIETPSGKITPEEFPSYSIYDTSVMAAQFYVTYANSEFFPWLQGKRANSVYMRAFPYGFRYQVPPELIGKVSCWNFVPKELRGPCKSAISKKEAHQTAQYKCAGCRLKRGRCSLMPNDFDELQAMWQHAQDHGYTFDRANRRAFAKEESLQNKRKKQEKENTTQEPEIKGQKHSENEIPFESISPPATSTKTIPKQALLVLNNPPKSTSEISNSATVTSINQTKDLISPYCHIFELSSSCPSHEAQYWDVLDIGENVDPQVFQGPRSFKLFGTMITPKPLPLPPFTSPPPPPSPSFSPSPSPFSPSSSASDSSSTSCSCPSSSPAPSFVPPSPLPSSPSPLSSPSFAPSPSSPSPLSSPFLPSSISSPSLPSSSFLLSSASSAPSPSSSTIYSSPSTSSSSSSTSPSSAYTFSSSTKSASPPSSSPSIFSSPCPSSTSSPSFSSSSPYSSSSSTKSASSSSTKSASSSSTTPSIFSSLSSSPSSSSPSSSSSSSPSSPSSSTKSASSPSSTTLSPSSTSPPFSYSSHGPSSPPSLDLSKPEIIDLTID